MILQPVQLRELLQRLGNQLVAFRVRALLYFDRMIEQALRLGVFAFEDIRLSQSQFPESNCRMVRPVGPAKSVERLEYGLFCQAWLVGENVVDTPVQKDLGNSWRIGAECGRIHR